MNSTVTKVEAQSGSYVLRHFPSAMGWSTKWLAYEPLCLWGHREVHPSVYTCSYEVHTIRFFPLKSVRERFDSIASVYNVCRANMRILPMTVFQQDMKGIHRDYSIGDRQQNCVRLLGWICGQPTSVNSIRSWNLPLNQFFHCLLLTPLNSLTPLNCRLLTPQFFSLWRVEALYPDTWEWRPGVVRLSAALCPASDSSCAFFFGCTVWDSLSSMTWNQHATLFEAAIGVWCILDSLGRSKRPNVHVYTGRWVEPSLAVAMPRKTWAWNRGFSSEDPSCWTWVCSHKLRRRWCFLQMTLIHLIPSCRQLIVDVCWFATWYTGQVLPATWHRCTVPPGLRQKAHSIH